MALLTKILNPITDALGITDSGAAGRAHEAMQQGQSSANAQLDADLMPTMSALSQVAQGRDLGTNLGLYETAVGDAQAKTGQAGNLALAQKDAGRSGNVRSYLNPMMDEMLARTSQAMQGGAGAALQSSATNKDISGAVANQAGNLWQQAFQNAMSDASTNLGVASNFGQSAAQGANLSTQLLEQQNKPIEDLLTLQNDRAMQRYAANTGMTQADMALQGQKQTIL